MLNKSATCLVGLLEKYYALSDEERPVYIYGFELLLSTLSSMITIISISIIIGEPSYAMFFLLFFFFFAFIHRRLSRKDLSQMLHNNQYAFYCYYSSYRVYSVFSNQMDHADSCNNFNGGNMDFCSYKKHPPPLL